MVLQGFRGFYGFLAVGGGSDQKLFLKLRAYRVTLEGLVRVPGVRLLRV